LELPFALQRLTRPGTMTAQSASATTSAPANCGPADLTLDHVRAAAARIDGAVVKTPMMHSITLSQITGAEIWLKFENLQFTAAYKERGALNALLQLTDEQRARGVIAASAGNHSQGLSYHGTRLGVPVTIVMPRTTPTVKVMQTESVGGNVVLEGETFDDANAHARKLEQEMGLTFVHPFDDPHVAAGQGTVALEMLEQKSDLDCLLILPCNALIPATQLRIFISLWMEEMVAEEIHITWFLR